MRRVTGASWWRALILGGVVLASCTTLQAKDHSTEILWDNWGVPHVYAPTDERMFYALGWAQAKLHGNHLLEDYGKARARAAEYWGEAFLENDRRLLTLRVPQRAQDWSNRQKPQVRAWVDAFVSGINDYVARHPDETGDAVKQVLPITAVDVFAMQQFMSLAIFAERFIKQAVPSPNTRGSNTWAIGASRSASGHPMLLLNGHVSWTLRQIEVQLTVGDRRVYGSSPVGVPTVPGGFSDHHAKAGTVTTIDNVDFYRLKRVAGGYLWDGKARAFDTTTQTIKVKQSDGTMGQETFMVHWSVHGPVLTMTDQDAIALRLTSLEQPFQIEQSWKMVWATSLQEFEAAMAGLQDHMSNHSYADRDGNIFYFSGGQVPRRATGDAAFWAGIVPGDTSSTLWTEFLSYDELPHYSNPPADWIHNANDPPWYSTFPQVLKAENYPKVMSSQRMKLRPQRSVRMITSNANMSIEQMEELKLSTRMELADRVLDDLLLAAGTQGGELLSHAAAVLAAWDRNADADSRGAVLFAAWFEDMGGKDDELYKVAWSEADPLGTPQGLADPVKATKALESASTRVLETWGALDVPWGDVYRFRCEDKDWPANGGDDKLGIFRNINFEKADNNQYVGNGGDAFVAIMEMGDKPRARILLSYGNSTQKHLPFHCNQMELLSRKQLRWALTEREDILANLYLREAL